MEEHFQRNYINACVRRYVACYDAIFINNITNETNTISYQFENRTKSTAIFPNTANRTTIQTDVRSHWEPITSSHGFNASGDGKHFTSIFLTRMKSVRYFFFSNEKRSIQLDSSKKRKLINATVCMDMDMCQKTYLIVSFPQTAWRSLFG